MTAAHCTSDGDGQAHPAFLFVVKVADHNLAEDDDISRFIAVKRVIQHPNYDAATTNFDFSILELETPIDFINSDYEKPICIPEGNDDYNGKTGIIAGWGYTEEDGEVLPDLLMHASVPIISNEMCLEDYLYGISPYMICAGYEMGGTDSCQGDSGGPLLVKNEGNHELVGFTHFREGCARPGKPGVYARITSVRDWIYQVIGSSSTTCARN